MRYVAAILCVMVVGLTTGCTEEAKEKEITADSIRYDMAGDLHTMTMTNDEYNNRAGHTMTVNWRNISDDIHRLLLLDHPQRAFNGPQTQN